MLSPATDHSGHAERCAGRQGTVARPRARGAAADRCGRRWKKGVRVSYCWVTWVAIGLVIGYIDQFYSNFQKVYIF
jgi:hypothetical protein